MRRQQILSTEGWRDAARDELMLITLYDKPKDLPEHFVLRAQYVAAGKPTELSPPLLFQTAHDAQNFVEFAFPWMTRVASDPSEEPNVVGVWL